MHISFSPRRRRAELVGLGGAVVNEARNGVVLSRRTRAGMALAPISTVCTPSHLLLAIARMRPTQFEPAWAGTESRRLTRRFDQADQPSAEKNGRVDRRPQKTSMIEETFYATHLFLSPARAPGEIPSGPQPGVFDRASFVAFARGARRQLPIPHGPGGQAQRRRRGSTLGRLRGQNRRR